MASRSPLDPTPTSLAISAPPSVMTLDQCIGGWLHEKQGHSDSTKTLVAYQA